MNKTNYLILTLILCFSIAFIVYPLKFAFADEFSDWANAYIEAGEAVNHDVTDPNFNPPPSPTDTTTDTTTSTNGETPPPVETSTVQVTLYNVPDEDSLAMPPTLQIGEIWTGPSGQIYIGVTPSPQVIADAEGLNVILTSEMVPYVAPTPTDTTTNTTNGTPDTTNGPPDTTNGTTDTTQQVCRCVTVYSYTPCSSDSACIGGGPSNGGTPSPPPPPPPLPPPPKYSCNKSTWTCSQDSSGKYSSPSSCRDACVEPPCMIDYFEFPKRAWVGYSITGRWSASDWCVDCDVTCTPYPECVWKQDNIGTGFDEHEFTLEQSGDYIYTLTCYKQGGRDQKQVTVSLEALNLPWWREIIPVLPGFLRGIWK